MFCGEPAFPDNSVQLGIDPRGTERLTKLRTGCGDTRSDVLATYIVPDRWRALLRSSHLSQRWERPLFPDIDGFEVYASVCVLHQYFYPPFGVYKPLLAFA